MAGGGDDPSAGGGGAMAGNGEYGPVDGLGINRFLDFVIDKKYLTAHSF
jgi:hypothetical protein